MLPFIAMLASGIYNIVDTIFIGKGIGTLAVGGVGIVFPIQTLYNAFAQMISIGAASAISRSFRRKKGRLCKSSHHKCLYSNDSYFSSIDDY